MFHPELEKEKIDNYPTIRTILQETYGNTIHNIGICTIKAEEHGNLSYGFHITIPGKDAPDYFFKIERDPEPASEVERERLQIVHELMESLHDSARDGKSAIDSAKIIRTKDNDFSGKIPKISGLPKDLIGKNISLQTNLRAIAVPLKEVVAKQREKADNDGKFAIDIDMTNYPSHLVEKMSSTVGRLHKFGENKEVPEHISFHMESFDQTKSSMESLGAGKDIRRQYYNIISAIPNPTEKQRKVMNFMKDLVGEIGEGKLQTFKDNFSNSKETYKEVERLPKTGTVHHDTHPLNFLYRNENGKETIIPVDMDFLSRGERIEDLALMIGQTMVDAKAKQIGFVMNEDATTSLVRGYDEVARLTPDETKHLFAHAKCWRVGSAIDKLSKIAQLTPERMHDESFLDKIDTNFSLQNELDIFERHTKREKNDIAPIVNKTRGETLNALDLGNTTSELSDKVKEQAKALSVKINTKAKPDGEITTSDDKNKWIDRTAADTHKTGCNRTPGGSREI